MKKVLTLLFAVIFVAFSWAAAQAADELQKKRCAAMSCAQPNVLKKVRCQLVAVHFCQPEAGPVHFELWRDGKIVLQHTKIKKRCDTYRICRFALARAERAILCSKTEGGRVIATSGPPLEEFLATSRKRPLVLQNVPPHPSRQQN